MISSSYEFQAHQQHSQRRCCFSQTALLWFEVLPDMSLALSGLSLALPGLSPALPGLSPALPGAPRLVVGVSSYSEGQQDCLPRVWYSPEIDSSKFTLHILPDTPGGFQWLKYILLMLCNATCHLANGKYVSLCPRVQGSVRAIRAIRHTRVFLTETRVVADAEGHNCCYGTKLILWIPPPVARVHLVLDSTTLRVSMIHWLTIEVCLKWAMC